MKKMLLLFVIPWLVYAADEIMIPRTRLRIETSLRQTQKLELLHGETRQLIFQFLSYQIPMDISESSVTLHAMTNGMDEGYSFQISGVSSNDGLALVTVPVDSWIPVGLSNGTWMIEIDQTNSARILSASGPLIISGINPIYSVPRSHKRIKIQ